MSKRYSLKEPLYLEPVYVQHERNAREEFNNNIFRSERYIRFVRYSNSISNYDIQQISKKDYDIPKLQTVINCGNSTVLPEIMEGFYPQQERQQLPQPAIQLVKFQELPVIYHNKKVKDILLTECGKPDSFMLYKKNKAKLLSDKKPSRRVKTMPSSAPRELKELHQKLFPEISDFQNPKAIQRRANSNSTEPKKSISTTQTPTKKPQQRRIYQRAKDEELSFKDILKDYQSASDYNFPPTKFLKVLQCLDKSSQIHEKELEADVLNQQKSNYHKKFDRLLVNQQDSYRMHLSHLREYKKTKMRDT